VLLRRCFVRGDVLLQKRFVKETFCLETFCKKTFCMCVMSRIIHMMKAAGRPTMHNHDVAVDLLSTIRAMKAPISLL
jgi:hypothetical protein